MVATPISATAVAVAEALLDRRKLCDLKAGPIQVEVCRAGNAVWALFSRGGEQVAWRLAHFWGATIEVNCQSVSDESCSIEISSTLGVQMVEVRKICDEPSCFQARVDLESKEPIVVSHSFRDLYLLTDAGVPKGSAHATQRGLNAGLVHLRFEGFGSVFYFQDFTELQDYFRAVECGPEGAVGGRWPEFGYAAPINTESSLPAGKLTLSNSFLCLEPVEPKDPLAVCEQFNRSLACIYLSLNRPETEFYDWPARAKRTLKDLQDERVIRRDYGSTYLRPYTDAEYPDSMVQMSLIAALVGYGQWRKRRVPLADKLIPGMNRFYDSKLKTLRRYLPNVGKDKNRNEVDSWYLYHPLKNLALMAKDGEEWAKTLFFESLDFTIRAAHHFEYVWPVKYDLTTLEVTEENRKEGDPGQSDVGGIYCYVMLQAYELTGDERYIREAERAIEALSGRTFDLLYQSNLSSIGCSACVWLAQVTGKAEYGRQAEVFLANLMHNTIIWKSRLAHAEHYETFMGVSCLHDGPYMAAYECFETFGALREVLERGGGVLSEPAKLLAGECARFALARLKGFFPDEVPAEAIAKQIRNGVVDRTLSIPVEDLYADGKPIGAVGQEVYGAGAPFVICKKAFRELRSRKGWIYCEYPFELSREDEEGVTLEVFGSNRARCQIALVTDEGFECVSSDAGEVQDDKSVVVPCGSTIRLAFGF